MKLLTGSQTFPHIFSDTKPYQDPGAVDKSSRAGGDMGSVLWRPELQTHAQDPENIFLQTLTQWLYDSCPARN